MLNVINFHTMFTRKLYIIASVLCAVMTWQNIVNLWASSAKRLHPAMPFLDRWMLLANILGTDSVATKELRGIVLEDSFLHTLCALFIAVEAIRAGISPLAYLILGFFSNGIFPMFLMNQYEQWMSANTFADPKPRMQVLRLSVLPLFAFFSSSMCVVAYVALTDRPMWVSLFGVECGKVIFACTMVPMALGHYSFPETVSALSASTSRHLKYVYLVAAVCGGFLIYQTRRDIEYYYDPIKSLLHPVWFWNSFVNQVHQVASDKKRGGALGSNMIGVAVGVPWISNHVTAAFFVISDRVGAVRPSLFCRLVFSALTLVHAPMFLPMYLCYREHLHEDFVNELTKGAATPPPLKVTPKKEDPFKGLGIRGAPRKR